jgi:hypothetical protein
MVFMEFTVLEWPHKKHYFVGTTIHHILEDTNGGTEWRGLQFGGYKTVNLEDVEKIDSPSLQDGINAISTRRAKSFWLGSKHSALI